MKRNYFSNLSGFTLIELLLVMSIISIISTIGIVNVVDYNRTQTFNTATSDFYSAIQLAKQRSQAQVVPTGCQTLNISLNGYQVRFNSDLSYQVVADCGSPSQFFSSSIKKSLPSGYSFSPASGTISFAVLSGTVQEANNSNNYEKITLSGSSQSKDFYIYNDGRITVK